MQFFVATVECDKDINARKRITTFFLIMKGENIMKKLITLVITITAILCLGVHVYAQDTITDAPTIIEEHFDNSKAEEVEVSSSDSIEEFPPMSGEDAAMIIFLVFFMQAIYSFIPWIFEKFEKNIEEYNDYDDYY